LDAGADASKNPPPCSEVERPKSNLTLATKIQEKPLLFAPLVIDEAFSILFYRAMAVLVAASPCALAIATPSAVLSGVARAARGGILIKGGGPLESLGQLNSIACDKTSTITEVEPRMTDVRSAEGVEEAELLGIAIAVEPVPALIAHQLRHLHLGITFGEP